MIGVISFFTLLVSVWHWSAYGATINNGPNLRRNVSSAWWLGQDTIENFFTYIGPAVNDRICQVPVMRFTAVTMSVTVGKDSIFTRIKPALPNIYRIVRAKHFHAIIIIPLHLSFTIR